MFLLPTCIGKLTSHADRKGSTRFALNGVQLEVTGNRFTAAATDSKRLAMIEGECINPRLDEEECFQYPSAKIPQLATAPNGASKALIPWDRLKDVCTRAEKLTKKAARTKPVLAALPVVLGDNVTTFGATSEEDSFSQEVKNVEGRFPPFKDIIPKGGDNVIRFALDPAYLAEMCELAKNFQTGDSHRIEIEVRVETSGVDRDRVCKPVMFRCESADGIKFTGLIMPLAS